MLKFFVELTQDYAPNSSIDRPQGDVVCFLLFFGASSSPPLFSSRFEQVVSPSKIGEDDEALGVKVDALSEEFCRFKELTGAGTVETE